MGAHTLTIMDMTAVLPDGEPASAAAEAEPSRLDPTERRLIERIRNGDDRAFATLVRTYQDRVFSLCVRMLGNREEAEDLAQEIFVAVHKNLDRFRAESLLSTWIYRVTRNRCLNRIKYLQRRVADAATPLESVADGRLAELSGRAPLRPDHHLEGRELQSVLEQALLSLPEEQRLMVLLRDVDGLSYEEITDICDLPAGTVKSRLHRARAALAAQVGVWQAAEAEADEPVRRAGSPQ